MCVAKCLQQVPGISSVNPHNNLFQMRRQTLGKVRDLPKRAKVVSIEMRFKPGPEPELLITKLYCSG